MKAIVTFVKTKEDISSNANFVVSKGLFQLSGWRIVEEVDLPRVMRLSKGKNHPMDGYVCIIEETVLTDFRQVYQWLDSRGLFYI